MRTNESMHRRTKMYWVIEALVLFIMSAAQLFTIRVMFRHHRPNKGILGQ